MVITKYVGQVIEVEYKLKNNGNVKTTFKSFPVLIPQGLADRLKSAPQYISGYLTSVITLKPILEDKSNREMVFLFAPKGGEIVYWGTIQSKGIKPPFYSVSIEPQRIEEFIYYIRVSKELPENYYNLGIVLSFHTDAKWYEDDILYIIHQPLIKILSEEETEKEKRKVSLISLSIK